MCPHTPLTPAAKLNKANAGFCEYSPVHFKLMCNYLPHAVLGWSTHFGRRSDCLRSYSRRAVHRMKVKALDTTIHSSDVHKPIFSILLIRRFADVARLS